MEGPTGKVFSLVASVPFSPIDIDLGLLSRGMWNSSFDRFRIWYMPPIEGQNDRPTAYVMVRKFDPEQGVLIFGHIEINLEPTADGGESSPSFTVGVLSNDETKARSILGAILDVPPSFHKRTDITLIERRWRTDPETVARFAANVFGTISNLTPGDKVYQLKVEVPSDIMSKVGPGLDNWWTEKGDAKEKPGDDEHVTSDCHSAE